MPLLVNPLPFWLQPRKLRTQMLADLLSDPNFDLHAGDSLTVPGNTLALKDIVAYDPASDGQPDTGFGGDSQAGIQEVRRANENAGNVLIADGRGNETPGPRSQTQTIGSGPPDDVPPTIGAGATQQNVWAANDIYDPKRFYDLVKNNGPWDYKQYDPRYQDFGNYNFGAVAAATGMFDLETILQQAGRAQCAAQTSDPKWGNPKSGPPYGDDPNDQYWITRGWNDYMSGMYGPPRRPRLGGLMPWAAGLYSNSIEKPLPFCASKTQCWSGGGEQ